MPRRPTVTVAICLFNSSRFIDETLESVFAQTFDDYDIVLVDDGSTDGCADAIERRYQNRRVTIVRQPHQGLSIARRVSIASATGELVAFLDHDDLWHPDKLERQVADARANPSVALLFSDCAYVDEHGQPLRLLSDHYRLADIDVTGTRGYAELLRRGCFVWQSTVLARTAALRSVNAFDPIYPYIADYDTWLQLARRYPIHYTPAVLAKWRVHANQFTNRCPDVTLQDHRNLLGQLYRIESIPRPIRIALGDRLFGQHRVSCRMLLRQGRVQLAAGAALGMFSYPDRLVAFCLGTIAETPIVGRPLVAVYKTLRRALRAPRRIGRAVQEAVSAPRPHVWIDGSSLGEPRTGHFSLVTELIRTLARQQTSAIHVVTSARGRAALLDRLQSDADRLQFHARSERVTPRGRPPNRETIEVIVWRGRFRWAGSRRIAIVQDLTTKIHPELHTAENVAEFDEFLTYVHRHADTVATVSENSRRDIIDRLAIFPDSVSVIPMPLNPCYRNPRFDPAFVRLHGIPGPYVLCVGVIEPRKNLRRLVRAFEMLKDEDAARDHVLVLAGPQGWDEGFRRFVMESDIYARIRTVGFVPLEHLPSLYHIASAVVYPSVYEGFGLPVFEAMSASGIVLASATSSLPEVLGDGITFDPYRTEAIAAALLGALSMTPAQAAAYRMRCRARAEALLERAAHAAPLPGLPAPLGAVRA
jgi:glycosyltransferase involved in cell wall biosynthesis